MIDRSGVFVLFTPQPTVAAPPPVPVLPPQPGPVALTVVARAVTQATLAVIIPGAAHLSPHASAVSAATATVGFPTLLPQLTLNQLFADNFQRANGPLGGSNGWTATGDGNAVIATNEASGTGAQLAGCYRSGETYGGDQFAQGTVGSVNNVSNDFVGLTLRHNVSTNAEYAMLYYFNGSQPVLNFYYRTNVGAYTLIDGVQLAGALAVGTALQFYVIGDVLVGSINGVPQMALVDDHIPAGGSPGITTFGTMTLDNFACGNATMGAALGVAIGSDNFNRANGNASAGQSMWTPITVSFSGVVSSDGTIVANELNISGSSGHRTAQRNEAYGPDQWAQIGVGSVPPTLGGSAFVGVILRWNGTTGYMYCYFMPGRVFRIYFIQAGQNSVALASVSCQNSGAGAPNPTNTVYTGVAYGTRLSIRANNTELISVNDSRCTAGQPGYQLYPTCTADNFAAGNVTAQISTAALTPTAGAASAARALVAPPASFLFASTDGNGVATYNATTPIVNDGNPLAVRVLQPTAPNTGIAHNFLYMLCVEAYPSATYGDPMGDVAVPLALANKYNVTIIAANLSGANWYGNSITDTGDQRVTYLVNDLTRWVASNFGSGGEKNLLIGFSRSGMGAQDLLLHYPNIFAKAASWDFPAQGMVNYNDYGADIFGNQANFAANYQLSTANVTALSGPFTGSNRIWLGGYNAFQTDVTNYDALLTSLGIPHTLGAMANITHEWQSGWVEPAVRSLVGIVSLTLTASAAASAIAGVTVPSGPPSLTPTAQAASAATAPVTMSPMANLQDAFASASVDTTKWGTSGTVSESSSGLALLATSTNSQVISKHVWALTGSSATVQVTPPPAGTNNSFMTGLELDVVSGSTSQGGAAWQFVATSGTRQIEPVYWTTAGATHGQTPITLPASPLWVRIRETGGTIYWDYSTDGSSWTTAFSIADPFATGALFARLWSGHYAAETDTNAIFQNFNTSVVYSDNFNRANGDPGSNWQTWSVQTRATITSNQLVLTDTSGADSGLLRNATGETYSADQFSEVAAPTTFTGNAIGPAVRMVNTMNGMYVAIWYSGNIGLFAITDGSSNSTQLGSNYPSTPTAGDRLRLTVKGSTLTVTLNGTTIITTTDTRFTSGLPGIAGNGAASCDNWFGGNS